MNHLSTDSLSESNNCSHTEVDVPSGDWRHSMKRAIRSLPQLLEQVQLNAEDMGRQMAAADDFPVFVPLEFRAKMQVGNPRDPLLLQVLPQSFETESTAGFTADPVGDLSASYAAGILKKYQGRALLITTGACAVHCRYCFRRHFPYQDAPKGIAAWEPQLEKIAADRSIREILLSGGDPLTLTDAVLAELVHRIEQIPHVTRLRIHTRLPVLIPSRVTPALAKMLTDSRLQTVLVIHANHPNELVDDVGKALLALADLPINVLNQSVLLRGINDDAQILAELSERLLAHRVMPYYLHQLDRVQGAAHFMVDRQRGIEIVQKLRDTLPGYAVPRYVEEIAGQASKQVIL